ncbi:MAG: hypothetical protein IJB87_05240 [Alistipes sp.]|nr:hypothetical protein [Alistipes sp.]MBQ4127578.1 hypothetical protein [Alistipes sp.]
MEDELLTLLFGSLLMLLVFIMPGCLLYKVIIQATTKKEVSFFKCLFKTLATIIVTLIVVFLLALLVNLLMGE